MSKLAGLCDDQGHVLCRYCRFADLTDAGRFECRIGDNPGPVNPDVAECFDGELADETKIWERQTR